ncbi:SDR family NAD(P)-dependent oxidoreductase [Ramlibacter tataouinensis]|uniref:3-oxoacyl-[acyl-carrier-protein] reductase-like protein n=1 Tax=Ramlibacter tataouinensis (strain ATCC BAA-407 / DSM 14655 / LMG 21543 / TTB310) TaxID=365046 RepID=F5XVJ3_RAMTT|nr:SDR family oxidoreductase [Ramlibacter tataouinensis]AEG91569.1 3-oxoacyl-[acyl-carrier-protein] reductase-like protein [Ramlibacter tataouinensis TTB310]
MNGTPPDRHIAVVSGGGRGLGLGIVEHLLAGGHKVASFSRRTTDAARALQQRHPDSFFFEELDLVKDGDCKRFVRAAAQRFGPVSLLVNNAGIALAGVVALFNDEDIDAVVDLNIKGTLRLTREVSRMMLAAGFGRIVNISSIVGTSGYRGLSVYGASKAALDGYTRALARELGSRGITVNSVAPGFLRTEMSQSLDDKQLRQIERRTPLGRLGTVKDVVGALDLLASPAGGFITGQVLVIDGGLTC